MRNRPQVERGKFPPAHRSTSKAAVLHHNAWCWNPDGMICQPMSTIAEAVPNKPNHVAFMLHGGCATAWKPLEMLECLLHRMRHEKAPPVSSEMSLTC